MVEMRLHDLVGVLRAGGLAQFLQAVARGRAGLVQAGRALAFLVPVAGVLVAVCHVDRLLSALVFPKRKAMAREHIPTERA
jgi:hypothetical protein